MTHSLKALIIASTLGACLTLAGCGSVIKVHRLDVQQGNIITTSMLKKLHNGMSESQVKAVLGTPVLTSVFNANTLEYVYTWQPGYGKFTEQRITVTFKNGHMTGYSQNQ